MNQEREGNYTHFENEIIKTEGLSEESRTNLLKCLGELKAKDDAVHEHTISSLELVKNKVEELEGQHPELTKTIQNLCTHLSALGL
jgi:hypothetical protein